MVPSSVLREDGFSLEFFTADDLDEALENSPLADTIGIDGYVLQERIIVPPRLAGEAVRFSTRTIAPERCNAPLIFIGHPDLPVQYASIVARAGEKASIEKRDASIEISAEGMNLLFSAPILSRSKSPHEFYSAFDGISKVISSSRMPESAIARTWLFMEDTLRDYELLNQARGLCFREWFSSADCIIPASTGVQGRLIGSPALAIEFCAFSGGRLSVRRLFSPLQNEPTAYGKLFSRGVAVRFPKNALLFISGTAPIDRTGASVHAGDFGRQMEFTLEALSAILRAAGGDFAGVIQAMVYLKRSADLDSCVRILDKAEFPRARALFQLDVDICRDDLLCEIEVTALISQRHDPRESG
jgi:enamine deaminase RidA (YjgF/YER057c/UK114 family)